MALINIDTVPKRVASFLKKATPEQGVEVLTYKRNRGAEIIKISDNAIHVREWGYHDETWQVNSKGLAKLLKTIIKREFPRSRKVRFYNLTSPEERGKERQKI